MHTKFYKGNKNSVEHLGGDLMVVSLGSGWILLRAVRVFVFMLRFLPAESQFNF